MDNGRLSILGLVAATCFKIRRCMCSTLSLERELLAEANTQAYLLYYPCRHK